MEPFAVMERFVKPSRRILAGHRRVDEFLQAAEDDLVAQATEDLELLEAVGGDSEVTAPVHAQRVHAPAGLVIDFAASILYDLGVSVMLSHQVARSIGLHPEIDVLVHLLPLELTGDLLNFLEEQMGTAKVNNIHLVSLGRAQLRIHRLHISEGKMDSLHVCGHLAPEGGLQCWRSGSLADQ